MPANGVKAELHAMIVGALSPASPSVFIQADSGSSSRAVADAGAGVAAAIHPAALSSPVEVVSCQREDDHDGLPGLAAPCQTADRRST